MEVANGIRHALHDHGVHSSTIQPEFAEEGEDVVEGEVSFGNLSLKSLQSSLSLFSTRHWDEFVIY